MVFEDLLVDISSPVQEEILRELEKALGVKVDIPAHAQTNGDAIVAIVEENTIDEVVFKTLREVVFKARLAAQDLIASCLQKDPALRPTMQQVFFAMHLSSCMHFPVVLSSLNVRCWITLS